VKKHKKTKTKFLSTLCVLVLIATLGGLFSACDLPSETVLAPVQETPSNVASSEVDDESDYSLNYAPDDEAEYLADYNTEYPEYYAAGYADYYFDYPEYYEEIAYITEASGVSHYLTEVLVARVIDGDTFETTDGERVRLIGVDAPERDQPGGSEATAFAHEHLYGQTVWLEADGNDTDNFGRLRRYVWLNIPGDVECPEYIQRYQLNALLLSTGHAEVMIIGNVRNAALFHEIAVPLIHTGDVQTQDEPEQATSDVLFIGNRNSEIFHLPTCRTLPAERNRVNFATRDDAIAAGHRACRNCNP